MKKLILVLLVLLATAGIGLKAQQAATIPVPDNRNSATFPVIAADVADATGETISKIFDLSTKKKVQYYTITADIDTTFHTAVLHKSVDVVLAGSWDAGNTWTTITTVPYHVTADTIFAYQDVSTGTSAPLLRVLITGLDSLGVQLKRLDGRFLNK